MDFDPCFQPGIGGPCLMVRHTQLDILVGFHRVGSQEGSGKLRKDIKLGKRGILEERTVSHRKDYARTNINQNKLM